MKDSLRTHSGRHYYPDQRSLLISSGENPLGDRERSAYSGWITGIADSIAGNAHHEVTTHTPLYASRGAPCRQMRAALRAARGPSRRAASNINGPRPGRRAAWHNGRAALWHEHRGIKHGGAPASAMLGVALQGSCHGLLHLGTPPVTGEKVTSRAATSAVAPAT